MGRKNNRMKITSDKNFTKFMESINKRSNNQSNSQTKNPKKKQYDSIEERNQERLKYALKQFQRERIEYEVLDETKGVVKVYHQTTGNQYIFYASTGTLRDVKNLRGIINVLEFLYT